jgi:hypothetical protein
VLSTPCSYPRAYVTIVFSLRTCLDHTIVACAQVGDTPDDVRAGVGAGGMAVGVLTPEADARLVLQPPSQRQKDDTETAESGASSATSALVSSMIDAGAVCIIRAGLAQLLDVLPPMVNCVAAMRVCYTCVRL